MAESHAAEDPNAAPMHHDIQERFSQLQVLICVVAGIAAITAGLIAGLLFANN